METEKEFLAKQCSEKQEYNQNEDRIIIHSTQIVSDEDVLSKLKCESINLSRNNDVKCQTIVSDDRTNEFYINDEPIDLTMMNNKNIKEEDKLTNYQTQVFTIPPSPQESVFGINHPNDYYPKRRRKRRKFAYTADGKLVLVPNEEIIQSPSSFSESKQQEILKAAKSLFSKRTRTLYHWMYPNAAKQQIKAAVASSWESLGTEEKDFYISQVLGRFGFPQSSLMVNPQLGGIKELPMIAETPTNRSRSQELQNAISSIMPENPMSQGVGSSLTFEEFEEINELTKKRRGRPPGSYSKKQKFNLNGNLAQDFKDDPELSQELQQFATIFNLSKL